MQGKSPSITTDPNAVQNKGKLINLLMLIGLNRAIFKSTILKFSEKFDHSFWHVSIFGNMFPESPVSLQSNETVPLRKLVIIIYSVVSQGLLQLQAWVCLGFYTRAADFYE